MNAHEHYETVAIMMGLEPVVDVIMRAVELGVDDQTFVDMLMELYQ